jgi:hypothetical protein
MVTGVECGQSGDKRGVRWSYGTNNQCEAAARIAKTRTPHDKRFCFFFQKEGLPYWLDRGKEEVLFGKKEPKKSFLTGPGGENPLALFRGR